MRVYCESVERVMLEQLNQRAKSICDLVSQNAQILDVQKTSCGNGATLLDFGTNRLGTLAGGIELSRICLAGLAEVAIIPPTSGTPWSRVQVTTDHPLAACIAAQYAGWAFSTESYFSMCSGPIRLARGNEEILQAYSLSSNEPSAVAIFEASHLPSESDISELAQQCGRNAEDVTICVARTSSLPGSMQVVARSIETAMHKMFEIGFDLSRVQRAVGSAPIPPIGNDDYQSMGWTNDCVLYGGEVHLWMSNADDIYTLADQLPSCTSSEYGRPFIDIFEENERDFYKVDRKLFSPAQVTLNCVTTGRSTTTGSIRTDLLKSSFDWKND